MNLPSQYTASTPGYKPEDSPEWEGIENVVMHTNIGCDPTDNPFIDLLVHHEDDGIVGAIWSKINDNSFSFDIAVIPDHQDAKLGSTLLDKMLERYEVTKAYKPDVKMGVTVVNPILMHAMFRRGFYVERDLRERPGEDCVIMSDSPGLKDFLDAAMKSSPKETMEALNNGAVTAGVGIDQWIKVVSDWCNETTALNGSFKEGMEHSITELPMTYLDKAFLWEQVQHVCGTRKNIPLQDPHKFQIEDEIDFNPSVQSAPAQYNNEYVSLAPGR